MVKGPPEWFPFLPRERERGTDGRERRREDFVSVACFEALRRRGGSPPRLFPSHLSFLLPYSLSSCSSLRTVSLMVGMPSYAKPLGTYPWGTPVS